MMLSATGTPTRHAKTILLVFAVLFAVLAPLSGHAGTAVGDFEIEGNTLDDPAGGPIDWSTPPPNLVHIPDTSGAGDTSTFGGGSKENLPDTTWSVETGKSPQKDDITDAHVAFRDIGSDSFVYMDFTRLFENGAAYATFEFNALRETYVNSQGSTIPKRSNGDVEIAMSIENGGQVLNLDLKQWAGDQFSGTWTSLGAGAKGTTWDLATNASQQGKWTYAEAVLNFSAFIPKGCPGFGAVWVKTVTSKSFETANLADFTDRQPINLSTCAVKTFSFTFNPAPIDGTKVFAVYTVPGPESRELELTPDINATYTATDSQVPPGTLTSHFEVRNDLDGDGTFDDVVWSSPSSSETLSEGESKTNPGSLVYQVVLGPKNQENFATRDHVFTAKVSEVGTGVPLVGVTVNFSASPCGTLDPTSDVTDANGEATTTLSSATACTTTVTAWVNGAGGTAGLDQNEASDGTGKVFVEYTLAVTPPAAVNVKDSNHTFTVTLFRDTGSGPVGYGGQQLELTLSIGTATGAHFVSINGDTSNTGTTGTCTTKPDGTCEVVVTSPTTGTLSLDVSYTTINDSGQGTFTSSGAKLFVDYRVTVTPGDAENEVGTPHTFTVLVEKDEGGGFQPVSGQSVDLSLDPDGSDAHFVSINDDTSNTGTTGTCTTKADGTCEVVILATTPGTATLTASIDVALDSGTLHREDFGTKLFSDFRLTVTPGSDTNEVGSPHTFIVTLERNDGAGFVAYAGQQVDMTLTIGATDAHFGSINGNPASGTTGTCTTDANGVCSVVINSSDPGTVTLAAGWSGQIGQSTATRSAQATKTYVEATAVKLACPTDRTAPGGHVDYTIQITVEGTDVHNATVTDNLPPEFVFESASPTPTSAPNPGDNNGTVTWNLGTVPAGTNTSFTISGHIDPATASGTTVHNVAVFDGDEITAKTATKDIVVSTEGAGASGRAYGVSADILNGTLTVPPTPDTTLTPDELIGIHALAPTLDVGLLQVQNTPSVDNTQASDTAIASVANVAVDAGVVTVKAHTVVAKSSSTATGTSATSSRTGSTIQDLVINGTKYGDVHHPITVKVKNPLSGALVAEVRVLETIGSGAAGGVAQPDAGLFHSDMTVNGVHVIAYDIGDTPPDESTDIVVSHAESDASFPSGLPCNTSTPHVAGDAYLVKLFNLTPDAGSVQTGLVTLPVNGGDDDAAVEDSSPLGEVAGHTHTEGSLSPLAASSYAEVNNLDLLDGALRSQTIRADSAKPGADSAIIEDLHIGEVDVCEALGINGICKPDPDTVLLLDDDNIIVLLNEQIAEGTGTRVNAVHIFVVGKDNPLGLPVGAEVIISSAWADTTA